MGSRASYVIKRDGQTRVYGSHWGASSLMDDLIWGPDYATAAFEAQEELDELADIDGGDEGCALIDWDDRAMLWDFANCRLPVQRQLYNRILAETWPGWKIALAAGGNDDLLKHLGTSFEELLEDDDEDDDTQDDEDYDEEDEYGSREFEDDLIRTPEPITGPIRDVDEIEIGTWLTIRDPDGTCRDYFALEYDLDDFLEVGESVIERLDSFSALDSPPRELISVGGLVVDRREKVLWLWEESPHQWYEQIVKKAWKGWSLKCLPGGWRAQIDATGHDVADLDGGEREILGATVGELLCDSSKDPRATLATIAAIGHGVRNGCAGITLVVAVVGVGLSVWLDSPVIAIVAGVLFVLCFLPTVWLWRKTSFALRVMDDVASSPTRDAPTPDGLDIEQKRELLDPVLRRLGYPSIEELEASGELPDDEEDDYEGDYEDDEEDYDGEDEDYDEEDED